MTRGLAQPISTRGHVADVITPLVPGNMVVGVICAGDLATERDTIKDTIKRGIEQRPGAVWVCIEPKSDRITHDVLISLDVDPVVLPMNEEWRRKDAEHGYDLRRQWRDMEMLSLCDELIVFHKRTSNSPWRDRAQRGARGLFVVEVGPEPKKRARKTRKPVGA